MYKNFIVVMCYTLYVVFRFPSEEQLDDVTGTVFIGGLSGDPTIYRHVRNPDYVGCMRDLFVNGKRVLLFEEDQRRLRSHNVEKGCTLDSSRSCGTECTKEGCIDFLSNSSVPYCDCILPLSNCTAGGLFVLITCMGFVDCGYSVSNTSCFIIWFVCMLGFTLSC